MDLLNFSALDNVNRSTEYEIVGVLMKSVAPIGFCIIDDKAMDANATLVILSDERLPQKLSALPIWKVGGPALWERVIVRGMFERDIATGTRRCIRIREISFVEKTLTVSFDE